ncbi:MAG: DUF151 domain-containing protein [Bacteroidota bacterium]|nr:DUF151 domain-containing protein [Bacteroidota bacterium]
MKKVRINVLGLSVSQTQSGAYALVLAEEDGDRRIPIIIGPVEAQSIAIQLEGLTPPRPLTHDLFLNVARAFDITIKEVLIYKLEEGIFYAEIDCVQKGKEIRIDSRTSDAVALALRFDCPIYTTEDIMDKAGIVIEQEKTKDDLDESTDSDEENAEDLAELSLDDLNEILNEAVQEEDYERASKIRDEIKRRTRK